MSNVTVTPYFSEGDRYPCIIGVKAEGDEYEMAYVSKQQLVEMDERHRSEVAKLRELVRDMWPHVRHRSRMCDVCDLDCSTSSECLLYKPMRDRMRELGIEAGE